MSLMDPTRPVEGEASAGSAIVSTDVAADVDAPVTAGSTSERAARHDRGGRSDARSGTEAGLTIGTKLGVLLAALMAVLVVGSTVLILENRTTAREYQAILDREVRQSLLARQMQVEFKQKVQEWKDILLRGSDPADLATYRSNFATRDAKAKALYRQLLASNPDPMLGAQLRRYSELQRGVDAGYSLALAGFVASDGKDFRSADRAVRGIDRPASDQVDTIVSGLETRVAERVAEQQALTARRQQLTLIVGGGLVVMISALLVLALMRIVRPIRQLTRTADRVAAEGLPGAIAQVKALAPGEEPPTLPEFTVSSRDELRDLASALTSLQDSALRQAVEQHRADRETADMLVNLGRRNQNLLGRMLSYVTELERKEQDPDVLAQLFRLDHATTRIRRNAESMLVLAGATQTRTWSRPVPVIDVVRASLSEIEEYIRVDLHHVEDSLLNGSAVADVVHLVAELVENATHFSPPTTQVTIVGQRVREGYRLRVIDQGVGMTRRELDDANERIRRAEGGWSDTKLLGLYVVGRLARRRDIDVVLEPSAGRGITASVLLPASLLGTTPAPALTAPSGSSSASSAPSASAASAASSASSASAATLDPAQVLPAALEPMPMTAQAAPAASPDVAVVPDVGWAAPPTSSDEPWATLVPTSSSTSAAHGDDAARNGAELETFTAFTASAGSSATAGSSAVEPPATLPPVASRHDRVIDLTDAGRPGRADASASGATGMTWFGDPVSSAPAPTPAPASAPSPAPASAPSPATSATVPAGAMAPGSIPRRVRGAQLPDLGPAAEPVLARPDEGPGAAESLRWQLRSFQLDVQAARRAVNEPDRVGGPSPASRPAPGAPARPTHDEQAKRNHGHHHPEGE